MQWRFVPFQRYDPYMKTALNDVAISSVQGRGDPIIWLAGWDRACVTVGRDQCVADTVDVAEVESRELPVARRQDTGKAMYLTEQGQVTWNVVLPERDDEDASDDESDDALDPVYEAMCNIVVTALDQLEINASYREDHAVTVDGGKISGVRARQSHGVTHISGTVLHRVDPEQVITLLMPEKEATLESVKWLQGRVATVDKAVEAPFQDTVDALRTAFLADKDYEEQGWSDQEQDAAEQLAKKYRSDAWVYRNRRRSEENQDED